MSKQHPKKPKAAAHEEAPARRFPRIPAKNSIVVRKLGGPHQGGVTVTKVLGTGGCSFLHAEPHGVGETLFLSILVGGDLAEARVRVVYSRPQEDGSQEIGVEFLEVSEKDLERIRGLVEGCAAS
jgi:hypothetical protein